MNTTYFKNLIMNKVFRNTGTLPTNYYIGLSSTTPTAAGGNVSEPSTSGTGYARVQLSALSAASNGVIQNSADITFPESTTAWFPSSTPATYYVIYDAATNGNLLMYNSLTNSRVIEVNTVAKISSGSLQLRLTD